MNALQADAFAEKIIEALRIAPALRGDLIFKTKLELNSEEDLHIFDSELKRLVEAGTITREPRASKWLYRLTENEAPPADDSVTPLQAFRALDGSLHETYVAARAHNHLLKVIPSIDAFVRKFYTTAEADAEFARAVLLEYETDRLKRA